MRFKQEVLGHVKGAGLSKWPLHRRITAPWQLLTDYGLGQKYFHGNPTNCTKPQPLNKNKHQNTITNMAPTSTALREEGNALYKLGKFTEGAIPIL